MADQVVERVESVNILDCISHTLSKDQQHMMIVFRVGDPGDPDTHRNFAVTLPAARMRWLLGVVFSAVNMVEQAGKQSGNSVLHFPASYGVATAPDLDAAAFVASDGKTHFPANKGKVVIAFDRGLPSEINFVVMNAPAMMLAETIRRGVAPRLTDDEKAELKAAKAPV